MKRGRQRSPVPAVERCVDLCELLADRPGLSLSEISLALGLPKSSVHNILSVLTERGWVEREKDSRRYSLGLSVLYLAGRVGRRLRLEQVVQAQIDELAQASGETVHLGVLDPTDWQVMYVAKADSPRSVRLSSYVGKKVPAYCTALGKVLLASLDDRLLGEYLLTQELKPRTERTIVSAAALATEIQAVRSNGYAIDNEEHEVGVRCVAVPVLGENGQVVAGISVSGPSYRLTMDAVERVLPQLKLVARNVGQVAKSGSVDHSWPRSRG